MACTPAQFYCKPLWYVSVERAKSTVRADWGRTIGKMKAALRKDALGKQHGQQ